MRLYRKEKHWDNYWEVHIDFPWIGKKTREELFAGAVEYGFDFPTQCYLHKEDKDCYWYFALRILGFGVTITRQNGY